MRKEHKKHNAPKIGEISGPHKRATQLGQTNLLIKHPYFLLHVRNDMFGRQVLHEVLHLFSKIYTHQNIQLKRAAEGI